MRKRGWIRRTDLPFCPRLSVHKPSDRVFVEYRESYNAEWLWVRRSRLDEYSSALGSVSSLLRKSQSERLFLIDEEKTRSKIVSKHSVVYPQEYIGREHCDTYEYWHLSLQLHRKFRLPSLERLLEYIFPSDEGDHLRLIIGIDQTWRKSWLQWPTSIMWILYQRIRESHRKSFRQRRAKRPTVCGFRSPKFELSVRWLRMRKQEMIQWYVRNTRHTRNWNLRS